uniref:Neuronal pentraxin-1-like n=1 Tax=Stegastes partitus TaxID=144197 RepID=A0A3B4Z8E7_9TELE
HPRFLCTPIPVDADPSCFPAAGPGSGGAAAGHQNAPPAGWWGASEEAKATILHLRESLVQQKETILDQRETIRELTAKLSLCEGFGHGHDEHHGSAPHHRTYPDNGHHGNQKGHHGNLIPDSPHHASSAGGHRSDGGAGRQQKDKHGTPGDISSSPEQMERMLQALKERLDNLQKRNSSTSYSSSLKELLQRKIGALEEQLHRHTSALSGADHHGDDGDHHDHHDDDDDGHHDNNHYDHHGNNDGHHDDHYDHHDDDGHHDDHQDDHHDGHHDSDDEHHGDHSDHHDDSHNDDHHDADGDHDDGHHHDDDGSDHHSNEADSHSYLPHTGYRTPGPRSNKLETILNQKKPQSPDAFQISFPMRTNYMYGRLKRTLLQEIFALTLCLWIKAGVGPGLGTPFSYSAPGQSNELVLIEWGNNPIELLIDDKTATLPLSLSDGKWHHVCVTWSTRDGQWEAYQDGVLRGSGMNLSPWHPIRPGGVFILGQEQDTLGGRFDATQSFIGEMSDLHMWSHVLSAADIYGLASCGSHLRGDVIAWAESEVELYGGVARYPFDP